MPTSVVRLDNRQTQQSCWVALWPVPWLSIDFKPLDSLNTGVITSSGVSHRGSRKFHPTVEIFPSPVNYLVRGWPVWARFQQPLSETRYVAVAPLNAALPASYLPFTASCEPLSELAVRHHPAQEAVYRILLPSRHHETPAVSPSWPPW